MTVSSTINREQYATNGVTTAFTIHFPFFDTTDVNAIFVSSGGVSTTLMINTDFTVTGGSGSGGTLTTTGSLSPLATGGTLTIYRELPFTQEDDYVEDDPLPADTLEGGFDRAAMRDQQLKDAQDRALTFPVTIDPGVSAELPTPSADTYLGWNSTADALENKTLPAGTAVYASLANTNAGIATNEAVTPAGLAGSNLAIAVAANTAANAASTAALAAGHARLMTNCSFTISVAANAMTIALKTAAGTDPSVSDPIKVAFRSATLASGAYVVRSITSALSLVVSAGSTLGFVTSELNSLHIGFIDNAGTVELAVSKSGSLWLEDRVVSTTAEGGAGAADSGTTLYSTTARSNVACRLACIARITADASTAGNWTAAPSRIVGVSANEYAAYKNTCKAWVNFNGTGTVAIRDGFNVASITDNGSGDYTVNLLTAMADANYAVALSTGVTATIVACALAAAPTVSAIRVATYNGSFALTDCAHVHVAIVGGNQ